MGNIVLRFNRTKHNIRLHEMTTSRDSSPGPLPSPTGYPIVGNLPQLRGDEMLWEKVDNFRHTHGDLVMLHLGSLKMLVVFGHKLVKKLLVEKSEGFKHRPQWLSEVKSLQLFNGIVWSNDLQNVELRKFVMPALNPGLGPETLAQKVQTEANCLVEAIANDSSLQSSDQVRWMLYRSICNLKCAVIFGQRFDYDNPEFVEFMGLMDQMLQRHGVKNLKNFFPILQHLPYDSKTKNLIEVLADIKEFILNRVTKAEETYKEDSLRSVIDLYIKQQREADTKSEESPITADHLTHVCRDLFVAGTENVTCAVIWAIGYCMKYRDVADKCRENIKQVVGDKKSVSLEDVNNMTYVRATINEVLRVANIAPLSVPHATTEEEVFEGFKIPRHTMVLTHLVSVHNDPDYWDKPELFNPDRFISSDGALIEKEAFYPFSIGPRYCVADHLAKMEISVMFVNILHNLEMTTPDGTEGPTLKPTQPGAFVEPESFGIKFTRI